MGLISLKFHSYLKHVEFCDSVCFMKINTHTHIALILREDCHVIQTSIIEFVKQF